MRPDFYVYVYFRPNGVPCYVGKGRGRRWLAHLAKSPNRHLTAIIKASGGDLPILKIREGLTDSEAFLIEVAFINAIGRKANGGPLVNQTDGGDGSAGRKMTTEEKRKRREILNRPETKEKMRISHLGKPSPRKGIKASQETCEKLRIASTGRVQSPETIAKRVDKTRGLKRTPEFGTESSKRQIGKKISDETRLKMSIAKKGYQQSEAHKAAIKKGRNEPTAKAAMVAGAKLGAERRWRPYATP